MGKFGCYIKDQLKNTDLTLQMIIDKLNNFNRIEELAKIEEYIEKIQEVFKDLTDNYTGSKGVPPL